MLGRLGGYDVLEIIGRGGMGVVLKGYDADLKRCVAIKVLSPHLAASSLARKRFAREAQAAAAVVHPHVMAIHQVQPAGRLPFLVMPLVAGESLAQRLAAQGRLELKETLRIGMQAAAGLAAAHEQGLVHRDVKPANILLEKGVERAVLTDFRLARAADDVSMTRWGIIAGTPQYMSPEQAQGKAVDGRSDLFSLGCVLYEMATGVSPFRTDSTLATLRRLIDDPPPAMASHDPELPPWFVGIVERLLEKEPSKRFDSAKEVSELLEGCLAHLQQPAGVPLPAGVPPLGGNGAGSLPPKGGTPARGTPPRFARTTFSKGVIAMITTLGIGLLGMLAMQATDPQDIAGQWAGEGWGRVTLTQTAPGEYTGTYTDTVGKEKEPGKIDLKWSRIERRFNGAWSEGEDRFGDLSIHPVGQEIRGALTTDAKSKINPATPRLADLVWMRDEHPSLSAASEREVSQSQKAPSAAVGIDKQRGRPWTETLENEATVQLVDVGGDGRWWGPDGAFTEKSPYGEYQEHGVQSLPKTGVQRTFLLRVYNHMAEPCGLNYEVTPRSELSGPMTLGLRALPNKPTPLGFAAYVPETAHTVTVRVGISTGPWKSIASAKYDETGQKQSSSAGSVGDLGGEIQALDVDMTAARGETPKRAVSVVALRWHAGLPIEEVRVIGLRRDGLVAEAEMQFKKPAVFADASLKQFKEIKLQHRPYTWIEFRDVMVQPEKEKVPGTVSHAVMLDTWFVRLDADAMKRWGLTHPGVAAHPIPAKISRVRELLEGVHRSDGPIERKALCGDGAIIYLKSPWGDAQELYTVRTDVAHDRCRVGFEVRAAAGGMQRYGWISATDGDCLLVDLSDFPQRTSAVPLPTDRQMVLIIAPTVVRPREEEQRVRPNAGKTSEGNRHAEGGSSAGAPHFGAVIERTLLVGDKKRCFYSLDRGAYVPSPTDFDPADQRNAAQFQRWLTANHVDIFVRLRNEHPVLVRSEMCTAVLQAEYFDHLSIEKLDPQGFRQAASMPAGLRNECDPQDPWPHEDIFVFETRGEVIGLLQITGTTGDPPGVKIRYKLVQQLQTVPPRGTAAVGEGKESPEMGGGGPPAPKEKRETARARRLPARPGRRRAAGPPPTPCRTRRTWARYGDGREWCDRRRPVGGFPCRHTANCGGPIFAGTMASTPRKRRNCRKSPTNITRRKSRPRIHAGNCKDSRRESARSKRSWQRKNSWSGSAKRSLTRNRVPAIGRHIHWPWRRTSRIRHQRKRSDWWSKWPRQSEGRSREC